MTEDKRPRGRPSEYKSEYAEQAKKLSELGATDYEIGEFFDVDVRTIYRWKLDHEDFCQAVIAGKDAADHRVERSLYNRAVGYTFDSEKLFHFQGLVTRAETKEHVPPDPGAAFNWLKNRQPDKWREKTTQELTGANGVPLTPTIILAGSPTTSSPPETVGSVPNKSD